MKKLFLLIGLALFLSGGIFAKKVELPEAREIAKNAYYDKLNRYYEPVKMNEVIISDHIILSENGDELIFVFNFTDFGFLLLAAEDAMVPVLGYNFEHPFNMSDHPDNLGYLLNDYKNNISHLRENKIAATPDIEARWDMWRNYSGYVPSDRSKDVEPLLTSTWNQDWPYNYYCPLDPSGPGGRAYVGCVATAMAQNMYYWRWPDQGEGDECYTPQNPAYGEQCADFGNTTYDWDGMIDNSDQKVNLPMALIGYHLAVAVHMDFGPDGSGAYSSWVPYAIKTYFKYSNTSAFVERQSTSWETWKGLMLNELEDAIPIYYSGFEPGAGGHAWNCDGYHSADDLFHFNFGWSGYYNGWYTIQNPGGFTSGHGYVKNFFPQDPSYPPFCQGQKELTNMTGTFEDGSGPQENYENNITCEWLINPQTEFDSVTDITLSFIILDTESNNDVITIYDGATTSDPVLETISGQTLPDPVTSTGNKILVVFETNGSTTASGWKAHYTTTQASWCSGLTTLTAQSGILDDGSGSFNYNNGTNCMWKLEPLHGADVTLTFTSFSTQEDTDVVKIYDGSNNQLLATISGEYTAGNLPDPVFAESGKLFITFQTDQVINAPGWTAEWNIGNVGLEEQTELFMDPELFPNPADDFLTVSFELDASQDIAIELVSLTGESLLRQQHSASAGRFLEKLPLDGFADGLYFLKITAGEKSMVNKIIIK